MITSSKRARNKLTLQEINITPLMDVLTVLLFFLIKIFTVNTMNIDIPEQLTLPTIINNAPPAEAVTLVVSKNQISIEHHQLFSLQRGSIPDSQLSSDKLSIPILTNFLNKEKSKRDQIYSSGKEKVELPSGKLLIQADKNTDFALLKIVLNSAALSGYTDYQFLGSAKQ